MLHRQDDDDIGDDADDDGRNAAQNIGKEPNRFAECIIPVFREIDPRHNPHRESEESSQADQNPCTGESVRHPAAGLPDGLRHLEEEVQIQRRKPLDEGVRKYQDQGCDGKEQAEQRKGIHHAILCFPPEKVSVS